MDYHSDQPDESPDRVALAIVRQPATVPVSDARYGGAILVNPGGPGGSGVAKVLNDGPQMRQIVDGDRSFDIIGFDPRGVNHSTPVLACFPDSVARQTWQLQVQAEGLLGSSEGSLRTAWRRARAFADGCSSGRGSGSGSENGTETGTGIDFLEHVNTTPVAADMVEIIERHGQWREREGVKAAAEVQVVLDARHVQGDQDTKQRQQQQQQQEQHHILQRTKWRKGCEQLLYWGFSYGTIVGATFASMYPERVGRLVLDGVVDAQDYYHGPWLANLADTDLILQQIMAYCAEAGPERCAFWRPGGAQAIQAAYNKLLHDIWADPLSVPGERQRESQTRQQRERQNQNQQGGRGRGREPGRSRSRGPEIITWSDVKMVVKNALYQPLALAPVMAELLQDITHGSPPGALFADYKQSAAEFARHSRCRSAQCEADGPFSDECVVPGWSELDATSAILCTDAEGIGRLTEDEFREYWEMLRRQSSAMGDYWAHTRLACAGWKARAKWREAGWGDQNRIGETGEGADEAGEQGEQETITTHHPILWISNTLDTVTPLRNAHRMAARFPASVLLEQLAEGHCSFAAPSLCTAKAVRRYFQTGRLPDRGTRCEVDVRPFGDQGQGQRQGQSLSQGQGRIETKKKNKPQQKYQQKQKQLDSSSPEAVLESKSEAVLEFDSEFESKVDAESRSRQDDDTDDADTDADAALFAALMDLARTGYMVRM
ncbi:hypothetical protein A1O3_01316 [Capronia epimyces CBS 606.96]|uniref:Peptidase S33 tripeptidyl aminopeptidase-like C-terminal domain-containing protein n=1 Tax=Capronia epimyces CBS 606.96 TaxID=1182542 RepID=W9ZE09_9EURO|nr:uncharacterized protein A1O3_01316 [Capronia epimyces CBS 606.96]EXJ92764.1 hypothetical protein A1O3_01316 [Capronia epimyces CBS 606.96]